MVVESSPGKYHRYVLTDVAPLDEFEAVQQRLVDDYGSDPKAKDRARVLRLPGFYHKKRPEQPHLVRLVHESCAQPLPWETAKQYFPPILQSTAMVVRSELPPAGSELLNPAELQSALEELKPDMGYLDWLKVGMALHSTGAGREAFKIWDQWSSRGTLYKQGECAYRWETFDRDRSNRVTVRSLFAMAYKEGWDGKISTSPAVLPLVDVQRRRMLSHFTDRHGVTMVNGKSVIVYRERDQNVERMTARFTTVGDMTNHMKPMKVPFVVRVDGETTIQEKPLLPIWMEARYRKTYKQLVFRPLAGLVAGDDKLPDGHVLNLYQGLAIVPRLADCQLILNHIHYVWCSGKTAATDYVLNWLTRMYQRPYERGHTVILLRSGEGTGKNIIVDLLVRSLGEHAYVAVKPEELTGRFNDHLATSVLVFANEAIWGGDKSQEGALKSLITDEDLPAERKFVPRFRVRNCTHVVMASNNDWVAPVGLDDRRFLILDVAEHEKGNTAYFHGLVQQIENGGTEGFVHYLLTRDITEFNPRELPNLGLNQQTKFDAKIRTADSITQWWVECLLEGAIWATNEEQNVFMRTERKRINLADGWKEGEIIIPTEKLHLAMQSGRKPTAATRKTPLLSGRSCGRWPRSQQPALGVRVSDHVYTKPRVSQGAAQNSTDSRNSLVPGKRMRWTNLDCLDCRNLCNY